MNEERVRRQIKKWEQIMLDEDPPEPLASYYLGLITAYYQVLQDE